MAKNTLKIKEKSKEIANKVGTVAQRTITSFTKKPILIVVKGLGRGKATKYEVENNILHVRGEKGRGKAGWDTTYSQGSIITLGSWMFKKPYMFCRHGAGRCVDFQADEDAPYFSMSEAQGVFDGGIMEWWKNFKGVKLDPTVKYLLLIILGVVVLSWLGIHP